MSPFIYRIANTRLSTRSVAVAALLGATLLAGPLAAQPAATPTPPALTAAQGAAKATDSRPETVEQRIASLHTSLKITSGEEGNWNGVATAMRDNAGAMEKLFAARAAETADSMTALQDLDAYGKFAQAHADGVKNLTVAFTTLYNSMPDAQKKVADVVFQDSGHRRGQAHS